MRFIKLAILSFIFLFLLITIISLFIPGSIRISKAKYLDNANDIMNVYIKDISKWKEWHPALVSIPANEFVISADSGLHVGGTAITPIKKGSDEMITEMTANGGRPVISGFKIIGEQAGDSSTLQWYMDFKLRWYPWEKFRSLFFENIYGSQMEQGLTNLKELSEGRRSSSN